MQTTSCTWYGMVWYGMVEVCKGAPVAVSGWVLADRHDLRPCAASSLHRGTISVSNILQTRFLASCGLRLVPGASSGIIYWVAYPLLGAMKSYEINTRLPLVCTTWYHTIPYHTIPYHGAQFLLLFTCRRFSSVQFSSHIQSSAHRLLAAHGARSCLSVRTQPPTATGAPSQTTSIPYHSKPDWCDATVGLQLLSSCLTTGKWIKGGSPRILVDIFGRPNVFC